MLSRRHFVKWTALLTLVWTLAASDLPAQSTPASLKVASFISDHMVLQRDQPVRLWGWAAPGAKVDVSFGAQQVSATANDQGRWQLDLKAMPARAEGATLTIKSGDQSIEVDDVLVGEVWLASGQSNMVWLLRNTDDADKEIASSTMPGVRMFLAATTPAKTPQTDIQGEWLVSNPENSPKFSAVAYYFAKKIHQETGVPVGILKTCWGGKRTECYASREAMLANVHGKEMLAQLDAQVASFDEEAARKRYERQLAQWEERTAEQRKANRQLPANQRKRLPRRPQPPTHPMLNPGNPTVLYNGMIHPFVGYTIRGAIWYQGEANAKPGLAPIYQEMFTLMIEDWRQRWGNDFSFYFVQLANFRQPSEEPGIDDDWATVQNQQRLTLKLKGTGMATINDIGAAGDIHPKNKRDVGNRLARWALKHDYGKDVVVSGPLYKNHRIDGNQVIVSFDHVGQGLKSGDGQPLKRFEIADQDGKWHWAEAKIKGDSVMLSSPQVERPTAARYAWASNPTGANLVNSEALPASIFTTE